MITKNYVPSHKAALYFNELVPLRGQSKRCAFFGHFYHPPDPDVPLTRPVVALPNGGWGVVHDTDVNDIVCGGSYFERDDKRSLLAVFRFGETYIYEGTSRIGVPKPPGVGFLSWVKVISGGTYACGSQNAVYRLDGRVWVDVASTLRVNYGGPGDPVLNAIDGFNEQDIYAVGYNGSIVHFDGSQWRRIETPTNQHLHQVLCHTDGRIYLCGRGGTVFRGGMNAWEDLSLPGYEEDFWGLTAFDGQVYVCTYKRLFRVIDGGLTDEVVRVNSAGSFYRLASNESCLWATTGTGRVLRFDRKDWVELIWPDSV
jgi:hypothetical protein